MCNSGLDTDAYQPVRIVDRLPAVAEQLAVDRVPAAFVFNIEAGAVIDEHLHDGIPALVCGTMQRGAAVTVSGIHLDAEVTTQLYRFLVLFFGRFVCNAFDPADSCCNHERGVSVSSRNQRIGAVSE